MDEYKGMDIRCLPVQLSCVAHSDLFAKWLWPRSLLAHTCLIQSCADDSGAAIRTTQSLTIERVMT